MVKLWLLLCGSSGRTQTKNKTAEIGTVIYIEGGELQFQEPAQTTEGAVFR